MILNNSQLASWALLVGIMSSNVLAMETLSDQEMGTVSGQDGVTLRYQGPDPDTNPAGENDGIAVDQLRITLDKGDATYENQVFSDNLKLVPIGPDGADPTEPLDIALAVDAYTHADTGNPGLALDLTWNRMRAQLNNLYMSDDTGASMGQLALDAPGRLLLLGDGGLFNTASNQARAMLNVGDMDFSDPSPSNWVINDPGQLYYRQSGAGSPELMLDNLGFLFNMREGVMGIDNSGILLESAPGTRTDFNLTFDLRYDGGGASPFQRTADDQPVIFFGWRGGWLDTRAHLSTQGIWDSAGNHSAGITASGGFNFANDYQVVLGEAGGDRGYIEFAQPISLAGASKDFEIGSLTLDAVHANQGVGGICFGANTNSFGSDGSSGCTASISQKPAQFLDIPAKDNAMALALRDGRLNAYSSQVVYRDDNSTTIDENWALIYTFGDVDGNIYLYPQTPQTGGGLVGDVLLAMQTFGGTDPQTRWKQGTHFMIGDTDKDLAIGLMGADLLFGASNMAIDLTGTGLQLHTNEEARFQLRGMLGGGDIPAMDVPQQMLYADLNLESDNFLFNLEPAPSNESYLGFSGFLSLTNLESDIANESGGAHGHDDGSYLSLAEPGFDRLDVDFRLAQVVGDLEVLDGKIDLRTNTETDHGRPELRISNTVKLGEQATQPGPGGVAGDIVEVGKVEFGGQSLGKMVIPGGQINTAITLKEQRPRN